MVLGVHEERKEVEGNGEGGRGEKEEREGHEFLTFRMVTWASNLRSGSGVSLDWMTICAHHGQISFITSLQKRYVFQLNNIFHKIRPSRCRVLKSE